VHARSTGGESVDQRLEHAIDVHIVRLEPVDLHMIGKRVRRVSRGGV
jgi:hypothetical protein